MDSEQNKTLEELELDLKQKKRLRYLENKKKFPRFLTLNRDGKDFVFTRITHGALKRHWYKVSLFVRTPVKIDDWIGVNPDFTIETITQFNSSQYDFIAWGFAKRGVDTGSCVVELPSEDVFRLLAENK